MTREAAVMGVPTFSVYAERMPAVDRSLEARGLLQRLQTLDQLADVGPRQREPRPPAELRARSKELSARFVELALDTAGRPVFPRGLARLRDP